MGWRSTRAAALARRADGVTAQRLGAEAVELSRTGDSASEQANALLALAQVLELSGRRDDAVTALREALALYEAKENLVSARRARERLAELNI
jgi:hypothetical protein